MSSAQCLRHFVKERLTAAAEEILGVFEKAIAAYEEEILRQRKLLDIVYKPEIRLQRAEHPQASDEEFHLDQQQCHQEINSNPDPNEPEPAQIKQEQEEPCTSEKTEQLVLKEEPETFKPPASPACEGNDRAESQTLDPNLTQRSDPCLVETETQTSIVNERLTLESDRESSALSEPNGDIEQKAHICRTCGKRFHIDKQLRLHMRIHTFRTVYGCSYCGKSFTFNSSLTRHLRVHTGEKPYECLLCGKRFNVSTTLKVHYRSHTGERPYKCSACDKAFTTCSNLKKHTALHKSAT